MADNDIDPDIDLDPALQPDSQPAPDNDDAPDDTPEAEPDDIDELGGEEPELEDYDLGEGLKFKGPKGLKDHILRQADYTRKTQDLASQRQQLEADRESITAYRQADREYRVNLGRMADVEEQLANFIQGPNGQMIGADKIDWASWFQTAPQVAQQHERRMQALERRKASLQRSVSEAEQRHETEAQQSTAKRIQSVLSSAEKEIPGWSQERYQDVIKMVDDQGISADAAKAIADRFDLGLLKVLDLALDGHRVRAARAAKAKPAPQQTDNVQPLPTVGKRRSTGSGTELSDKLTPEEWLKRRNAQLRQAG